MGSWVDTRQGAFSGTCNGVAYGFLAPFFDGDSYSGKAVRVTDSRFLNTSSGTLCTTVKGKKKCSVTVIDLTTLDASLAGFAGGFVSRCYAYFVPYFNGFQFASKVVKVHVANFSLANVTTIDLRTRDSQLAGFFGGFAHGDYGYLAPFRNVFGPVGKSNTRFTCDGFKNVDMTTAQSTKGGDHLSPSMFGKFVRFRLSNFSDANVEVLDLTAYDPDLRGFSGAFAVGNRAVLVPYRNRERANNQVGEQALVGNNQAIGALWSVISPRQSYASTWDPAGGGVGRASLARWSRSTSTTSRLSRSSTCPTRTRA